MKDLGSRQHGPDRNEDLSRLNEPNKGLKQNTSLDDDKSRIEKSREAGNKKLSDKDLGRKGNVKDRESGTGFRTMDEDEVNIM